MLSILIALSLVSLFAYLNAATGSTLPSPGGGRWWSHWMTALAQGAALYALTRDVGLALIFSAGWFVWRKPEFNCWMDFNTHGVSTPRTAFGRWLQRKFGPMDGNILLARFVICAGPASFLALWLRRPGLALLILLAAVASTLAYENWIKWWRSQNWREGLFPWPETAAGAFWGVAAAWAALT